MQNKHKVHSKILVPETAGSSESIKLVGRVTVLQIKPDGTCRKFEYKNTLTNAGKQLLYNFLVSSSAAPLAQDINYLAVGIGSSVPTASDLKLENEIARKQISSRFSDGMCKFGVQFEMNEQNPPGGEAITEAGLFMNATTQPDSGVLIARALFQPAVLKQQDEMLVVIWTMTLE